MKVLLALIAAFFLFVDHSVAQSSLLNYQGKLIGTNGVPFNGIVDVVVNVYTQSTGDSPIYTENIGNVVAQDGLYSFNWGMSGTSPVYRAEQVAVANGSQSVFNFTVGLPPVKSGSVTISGGPYTWKDDGSGSSSPANFLGSISDYEAGNMSAIFLSGNPSSGTVVSVSYVSPQIGIKPSPDEQYIEVVLDGLPLEPRVRITAVPIAYTSLSYSGDKLTVNGPIETTHGGVVFPDGTTQTSASPKNVFGQYEARTTSTVYLAEGDGFAICVANQDISQSFATIYSDPINPPTTVRLRGGANGYDVGLTLPIPKGHYWKVEATDPMTLYWLPVFK